MDILNVLKQQSENYQEIMKDKLDSIKDKSEIYLHHSTVFKDFYSRAYKPITQKGAGSKINRAEIEETLSRIKSDIDISHYQLNEISKDISETYNSTQDYKTGFKNKINYLTGILSDISIMAGEESEDAVVFKDSLSNYNFIDRDFSGGKQVNIATAEGVATLAIVSDENVTEKAIHIIVGGNGERGNHKVIKKVNIETDNADYNIHAKLKSADDPKDDPNSLIDSNPSTWMEYQKTGIPAINRDTYRLDWGTAQPMGEEVSLRINIELDKICSINWIDISQYIPERSNASAKIHSVKTSIDGSHYISVYGEDIIGERISSVAQSHMDKNLFNRQDNTKLTTQGILNFSPVKAKYMEIILKQDIAYNELLGDYYYNKTIKADNKVITTETIAHDQVPKAILDGPLGIYRVT